MMFIAFVYGAGLSGLTCMVLSKAQTDTIDALLGKYLRTLARGRMSWTREDGTVRCYTTAKVFLEWRLERTAVALRTRRLKWYQQWAKFPEAHGNVIAATFGTSAMERAAGVSRLLPRDWIGPCSTPMAIQFRNDLDALAEADENMRSWYAHRTSDLAILTPGTAEWQQWVCVDTSILRSAAQRGSGDEGERALEEEEEEEEKLARPYWCDHACVDDQGHETICGKRFATAQALQAHKRGAHNIRTLLTQLVVTNQCPWCLSTFLNRKTAIDHCHRAVEKYHNPWCAVSATMRSKTYSHCNITSAHTTRGRILFEKGAGMAVALAARPGWQLHGKRGADDQRGGAPKARPGTAAGSGGGGRPPPRGAGMFEPDVDPHEERLQ
eukprot:4908446-Pyramimonas_sp.AAC.1